MGGSPNNIYGGVWGCQWGGIFFTSENRGKIPTPRERSQCPIGGRAMIVGLPEHPFPNEITNQLQRNRIDFELKSWSREH